VYKWGCGQKTAIPETWTDEVLKVRQPLVGHYARFRGGGRSNHWSGKKLLNCEQLINQSTWSRFREGEL
jgi:hypothetical protein